MEPNYNINETKTLKPELYDTSNDSSLSLISVPQDNAIGTNDINNAITLLLFHKGKIHYDKYFKTPLMMWRGGVSTYPL